MDLLWLSAPALAMALWREEGSVRWRLNPTAIDWSLASGRNDAHWQALAEQLMAAAAPRAGGEAQVGGLPLHWNVAVLSPGWLAWLVPDSVSAAAELARQQERLAVATRAAGAGIWERDLEGRTLYWNEQMYRLFGLDPKDPRPVDEAADQIVDAPRRAAYLERLRRHVEEGAPYERELQVTWPDGSVRWLASVGQVLRDAQGRPLHMTGVTWDITQLKRAETAVRDKEAAERASRAKSEFMARMSHELRTPLNAVLGFADLMERDAKQPLVPVQRERVARIRTAGAHLLALIEDVLDVAAIESGSLSLLPEPVAIEAAFDDVRQWLAPLAENKAVGLQVCVGMHWVMVDARRLRQVLSNLLSNAIKYNRAGGTVRVEVEDASKAEQVDAPAPLHIVVRDDGRGMTAEQVQHLFEPFNRLGAEREGIEGVGIGLTIVRNLVQLMGGRIEVRSEAGRGTEVHLWLPAATRPAAAPDIAPLPLAAATVPELRVAYIEDNPINVMLVEELIATRPAVQLRCAVDGTSGVALAREWQPDVLLVDMQLPDFDGFEVLRRVRADAALASMRLIALSANAMADDVAQARRAGFDDYWTKPIDIDRFFGGLDALAAQRVGR